MSSTSKIVLGLLAAAAAGAAAGILLAPEKGSVTRQRLKDNFNEWIDELNGLLSRASEAATEEATADARREN
jgi:gas vesicle protein